MNVLLVLLLVFWLDVKSIYQYFSCASLSPNFCWFVSTMLFVTFTISPLTNTPYYRKIKKRTLILIKTKTKLEPCFFKKYAKQALKRLWKLFKTEVVNKKVKIYETWKIIFTLALTSRTKFRNIMTVTRYASPAETCCTQAWGEAQEGREGRRQGNSEKLFKVLFININF